MLSREIQLASYPTGRPAQENFAIVEVGVPPPEDGEVQVRNLWMTVDPYMRGLMTVVEGRAPGYQLGAPLTGRAIGQVTISRDPTLQVGDLVQSDFGWREAFNAKARRVKRLDVAGLPPEAYLGVAGAPGLTAYSGLLRVAQMRDGDIVMVSSAAGAVGSVACQIAKLKGHKVIGVAGGADKIKFLSEVLGLDAVVDYQANAGRLAEAFRAAAPEGIDVYFENVGGEHLEAALEVARPGARVALCGMISQYNSPKPYGVENLMQLVAKQIRLEGFNVYGQEDLREAFLRDCRQWIADGRMHWRQSVTEGLESAPEAFIGLFTGQSFGKALVRL